MAPSRPVLIAAKWGSDIEWDESLKLQAWNKQISCVHDLLKIFVDELRRAFGSGLIAAFFEGVGQTA